MNNTYSNKGMFIESLVDRSIKWYENKWKWHLEKRQIPIKIIKRINDSTIIGKLMAKAKVDYFGYINNFYIEIECKQTSKDYFDLNLISNSQLKYLKALKCNNSKGFILINFESCFQIVIIELCKLLDLYKSNKKIAKDEIIKAGKLLSIVYPGIIELEKIC